VNGPLLSAETGRGCVVRLAALEIDPAQLESYNVALQEEIETSIRVEPGVLKLYAVSVKDHPTQIRLFEMPYQNCPVRLLDCSQLFARGSPDKVLSFGRTNRLAGLIDDRRQNELLHRHV
jgi:hypothetical protein